MKLTLSLVRQQGDQSIKDFGYDIVWDNDQFKFVSILDSEVFNFDVLAANQVDGENRVVLAASASDIITIDGPFATLEFEFTGIDKSVEFSIENVSAKDENGNDVTLVNNPIDIIETIWNIEWIWS